MSKANPYETLFSEEEISSHRKKWLDIGLATDPTDWDKAERGIELAYQNAGLIPPKTILKFDSPLAGVIAAGNQVGNQVWAQVRDQVWSQVRNQVRNQVWNQVWNRVWNRVREQVWNQVQDQVRNQVWNQVRDQVRAQVRAQVGDQVWNQIGAQVIYGSQNVHWLSYLTIFSELEITQKLEGLVLLAESTGWYWPFEDLVIMTERPSRLIREGVKFRYIEYPDGFFIAPNLNEMEILAYASS